MYYGFIILWVTKEENVCVGEDFSSVSQLVLILRMRDHYLMTPSSMYTDQPKYIAEKLKSSRDCI